MISGIKVTMLIGTPWVLVFGETLFSRSPVLLNPFQLLPDLSLRYPLENCTR